MHAKNEIGIMKQYNKTILPLVVEGSFASCISQQDMACFFIHYIEDWGFILQSFFINGLSKYSNN